MFSVSLQTSGTIHLLGKVSYITVLLQGTLSLKALSLIVQSFNGMGCTKSGISEFCILLEKVLVLQVPKGVLTPAALLPDLIRGEAPIILP